jgi:carbamoyl-phosphate synthase large subunit
MQALNILFVGGAKRVSAAKAFKAAGQDLGFDVRIVAYEMGHGLPIESEAIVLQGLRFSDPEILADLRKVIAEHKIDIAMAYHDHAVGLLAQLSEETFVPACSLQRCETFFSKIASNRYFQEIGLPTAGFNQGVPAIAKPDKGSASQGLLRFYEQSELDAFLARPESSQYEVQRLISGQEYSVDGYIYMDGTGHFFAARKRLETLGGEAVRSLSVEHKGIQAACEILAQQEGIRGAITVQFIEDSQTGEIFTMEVNPRFGGAMLTTWGAGVPWFHMVICDAKGMPHPTVNFQANTLMVRSFQEHFFANHDAN